MLWIDIETYSEVSIRDGTDNYSRAAEIMLWAYAVDDAPVQVWDVTAGEAMPRELREALADESTLVVAHNAAFEASVFLHSGYSITPSRYRCTMAQALAHGLPGALDKLCEIFGIGEDKAKLKDGNQLVQLFCKPQPKGRKLRRATRATHPTEWARFIQYCGNDVEAMRAIARKMPNWNYQGDELALWQLDQRINQRGVHVDLDLVEAAIATAERVKAQLAGRAQEITDGEVAATTQRDKLLLHIAESYDIILPDLRGSTLERLLKSDADMPPVLRELFENRLAASSTSVSKYKRFAQLAGPDGRLRNTLQFCGASRTGRWCLAEGAPVLVLTEGGEVMEKPIETVSARDLVWDGVEWVAHQGLVFQGYKEVIEWDGVTATPDHEVYLSDTRSVTLAEAKEKGLRLWCGISRCEQRRPAGNSAAMLVRTYDLMNAGPRHRFTAYGRVVSNCGRGVQLQNLPRPTLKQKAIDAGIKMLKADCADLLYDNPMELMQSAVRGCIIAPPGKKLVVADLSNIEGRMLAWLAGETWKIKAFADFDAGKGHDLYALAYAKAFNITPEEVMDNKEYGDGSMRQIGKVMELACLGPDTKVLTDVGCVRLIDVTVNHKVWDGVEWVKHKGLVARGVKSVVNVAGIKVTPDHLIRTARTWTQARELATSESTLSRALVTGSENLPSSGTTPAALAAHPRWSLSSVRAVLRRTLSMITTSAKGRARAALNALESKRATGARTFGGTPTSFQTTATGADCLTASLPASTVATTRMTLDTEITGGGASTSTPLGARIVAHFSRTSQRLGGGTTRRSNSTALMSIADMNLATFVSSPSATTSKTDGKCATCNSASTTLNEKLATYDLAFAGPRSCFTVMSDRGPIIVHNCGYEGGVGAFLTFAAAYGIDLDDLAAKSLPNMPPRIIREAERAHEWAAQQNRTYGLSREAYMAADGNKRLWREAHPETSTFWKAVEQAVRSAIRQPGKTFHVRSIKVVKTQAWLRILLPSGRSLCYPSPKIDEDNKISYMGINQYSRKWQRLRTYSGKLCLAKNTTVLTLRGWMPIQEVVAGDMVWDGVEWVATGGAVCNGQRTVIKAYGAWMTPDHEVLTEKGWKHASQGSQYRRHACRLPDGYQAPRVGRAEVAVGGPLRLRGGETDGPVGVQKAGQEGDQSVLRVYAPGDHQGETHNARHVAAPGIRSVAINGGSLHVAVTPGLAQLRRAWDHGMRILAQIFHRVLAGHGVDVPARHDSGPHGQLQGLRPGELPVGGLQDAGAQPAALSDGGHPIRAHVASGTIGAHGDLHVDDLLPHAEGGVAGGTGATAGHIAEVYDLIDCGPRHRFVIATEGGLPLIVHNCENITQAASRDVIAYNLPHVEAAGYEVLVTVHDEDITAAPDTDEYNADHLAAIMATNPPWAKGLPLAAAGFEAYRYRKG